MCGILVDISPDGLEAGHPALEIIRHRGPDGRGAADFPLPGGLRLGLGHRRLAIIDLSARGAQPMSSPDGRFHITFNGEIFNYIELRDELRAAGAPFHTDSDTEVLLHAYALWGPASLHRLNGMFAFAVYDSARQGLFLARDRFGIKPLHYVNTPSRFAAASEIKQFTAFPDLPRHADGARLYDFLSWGDFAFDERTCWAGVRELPPGHCMSLDLGGWRPGAPAAPVRWYEPPFRVSFRGSFREAAEEYLRLLGDAVRLRLRADVPVGVLLSGGLDSTTLLGLCGRILGPEGVGALKAFSSCYEEKAFDERAYILPMLEHTRVPHALHFPKPEETAAALDQVIWHNDLPVQPRSTISHWLLYRFIQRESDNRVVILEGQGADEVFCGYADFFWPHMLGMALRLRWPAVLRDAIAIKRRYGYPWRVYYRKLMRTLAPGLDWEPPHPCLRPEALLPPGARPAIPVRREARTVMDTHKARMAILRYILHNVDRNSMASSREARVPYLDYRLVEFALSLPPEFKLAGGWNKRLNREAAAGLVPESVRWRGDKQGYSSPISVWAGRELKDHIARELGKACALPFVRASRVREAFAAFAAGRAPFDPFWWRLVAAARWLDMFKITDVPG